MVSYRLKGLLRDNSEVPEIKTRNRYLLIDHRELLMAILSQEVIDSGSNVEERT